MEETPDYNRTGRQHAALRRPGRVGHDRGVRQHDGRHRLRHRERPVAVGRHHHRPRDAPGRPRPRQRTSWSIRTVADIDEAHRSGRVGLVFGLEAATPIENEIDRLDVLYGLGLRQIGIAYSDANALGSGLSETSRRRPDRLRPPGGDPDERARPGHRPLPLLRPHRPRRVPAQRPAGVPDPRRRAGGLGHPPDEARRRAARGGRDRRRDRHVGRTAHHAVGRAPAAHDRVGDGPLPVLRRPGRHRARRRSGRTRSTATTSGCTRSSPTCSACAPPAGRTSSPSSTSTGWRTRPRTSRTSAAGWSSTASTTRRSGPSSAATSTGRCRRSGSASRAGSARRGRTVSRARRLAAPGG